MKNFVIKTKKVYKNLGLFSLRHYTKKTPKYLNFDDKKIGETVLFDDNKQARGDITIIGFPYDEGVERNGGRVGTRMAPTIFRDNILPRIGSVINYELSLKENLLEETDLIDTSKLQIIDWGNIEEHKTLETAHQILTKTVQRAIENNSTPFIIGGGNDQSFANVKALANVKGGENIAVINIDAHFDVRPLKNNQVHSGSPFRLLLTEIPNFKGENFYEFASQGMQCSYEHVKFLKEHKSKIFWLNNIKEKGVLNCFKEILNSIKADNIFVSFDTDSIKNFKGVSAPSPIGLSAQEALDICFEAGKNERVKMMDVSEFNPVIEEHDSGKLLGYMFGYFCYGHTLRSKK